MQHAGPPLDEVAVPKAVLRLAGEQPLTPVWENQLGGVTFQVGHGADRRFVKWAPPHSGLDLAAEAARMGWAIDFTPVPRVVDVGADADGSWLVTEGMTGDNAVSLQWLQRPEVAVRAAGHGLRRLHDALPVQACPFSWSVQDRLAQVCDRGVCVPSDFPPAPPIDQPVVCHGDPCVPNTLLDDTGQWAGHVDMAALGVADRWADIAVGSWSTEWNYGPGWEDEYLSAYGVDRDDERISFYRALWDL
jgi:kanamycin kinase